ncbi:DeoR/GlpR family DNA-binding transcription regulator [Verrucomicrobiota bacterium sgz303538]
MSNQSPSRSGDSPAAQSGALMTQHRRSKIAEIVHRQGAVRVNELAEILQVSEVTIRSDLVRLEKEGHLIRDRGGAIAKPAPKLVTSLLRVEQRAALNLEAKQRIASAAARMVSPGDTIILDAGTTVVEMTKLISGVTPLTVVTNALNAALELSASSEARIILLGGTFNRDSSSTLGPLTEHNLNELVVQKLFLGTQAMDLDHGLTDSTPEIAQVKRAMIRAARQVILLTDSSKWGKAGFIKVAPLRSVHTLITDNDLSEEARSAVERAGVELVVA